MQVGYKCLRPRTNNRSAFATKCMVLAAYLTVNMGIGCVIAITTTWFWWVYMMMGILLFLLGVRIIIFALSLLALVQVSRRHRRQRKTKAARAAALALGAARGNSSSDLGSGMNLLQSHQQFPSSQATSIDVCGSQLPALQQSLVQQQVQNGWGGFSAMQNKSQLLQQQCEVPLGDQSANLQPEWCTYSPV